MTILAFITGGSIDKSIIITAIICVTVVAICWINRNGRRKT